MKKVLITGASDGIGRAIALALAEDYELILFGRDSERLDRVASECGGAEVFAFDFAILNYLLFRLPSFC